MGAKAGCIHDFDGAILGAGEKPFAVLLETNRSDVVGVSIKAGRSSSGDIEQAQGWVAGCGDLLFVGCDLKLIDLRLWMLQRPLTDARGRFPEFDRVVIPWHTVVFKVVNAWASCMQNAQGRDAPAVASSTPDMAAPPSFTPPYTVP